MGVRQSYYMDAPSVVAEDSAIRLGVQVACKKGLRNVVMESDFLECVLSLANKNAKYLRDRELCHSTSKPIDGE